jgi:hypothetical protein
MRRILQNAFSVLLIIGGGYFLIVFLRRPTLSAALWNGAPGVFWFCLGAYLLWSDTMRLRKSS